MFGAAIAGRTVTDMCVRGGRNSIDCTYQERDTDTHLNSDGEVEAEAALASDGCH